MTEYINRGKIIARIKRYAAEVYGVDLDSTEQFSEDVFADIFCNGLWSAIELIEDAPAADVVPVVHGKWVSDGDGYHWTYNCSICAWKDGYPFNERHNFCPNCGAKMQGAGNE